MNYIEDMKGNEIVLGDTVKDAVTGMTGVVSCVTFWINGCVRIGVQPTALNKDGLPTDIQTLDIEQLLLIRNKKNIFLEDVKKSGGPTPDAVRR